MPLNVTVNQPLFADGCLRLERGGEGGVDDQNALS